MELKEALIAQPHLYIADVNGRPLMDGQVFFGEPDKDPEFYPIDIFYDNDLTKPAMQPVRTKGGFMFNAGDAVEVYAAETRYSVKVLDSLGRKVIYEPSMDRSVSLSELTSVKNDVEAQKLDTGITVTAKNGGVSRALSSRLSEVISVEDFGASSSNADNTSAINSAYAYAISKKGKLCFPSSYTVTGDIPELHNVASYGAGSIISNGNTYYIEPKGSERNTLYIKPNGTGDGLTKATAMGIPKIATTLRNLGTRSLDGSWVIHLCEGNYTDTGIYLADIPLFTKRLEFVGELSPTGDYLTVWDGSNQAENYAVRADLNSVGLRVMFKDIKIQNFNKHATNAGGLVFWGGHNVITENCYFLNTPIGVWVSRNSTHKTWGDTYENCSTWGISCQYNSSTAVGTASKRTQFKSCGIGLHVGRASIAHNDYCDYEDNNCDVHVSQNSRITHTAPTFKNWKTSSHCLASGAIDEGMEAGTFDSASIKTTTPILLTNTGANVTAVGGLGTEVLHATYVPTVPTTVTNTTAKTVLSISSGFGAWLNIPSYLLYQAETLQVRFISQLEGINSGDTSKYYLTGQGSAVTQELLVFDLPTGSWSGTITAYMDIRKDGSFYLHGTLVSTAGVFYAHNIIPAALVDSNFRSKLSDKVFWRTYTALGDTSDSITVLSQKTWITI